MTDLRKIHAISFDADGCLFHSGYFWKWNDLSAENQNQVINQNKTLLDQIKAERNQYDEEIVFNGSIRQSAWIDDINATNSKNPKFCTESCFSALMKVCSYLGATLHKYLLPDSWDNQPSGTTFDRALLHLDETSPPLSQNKHYYCPLAFISDESKLTLLYAQIHTIAQAYPEDDIIFDFYDDKGKSLHQKYVLLEELHDFFSRYPDMLPKNVVLRLHQYNGKDVTPYPRIQGRGEIDTNYAATIKRMIEIGKTHGPFLSKNNTHCVKYITPALLKENTLTYNFFRLYHPLNSTSTPTSSSRFGSCDLFNPQKLSLKMSNY